MNYEDKIRGLSDKNIKKSPYVLFPQLFTNQFYVQLKELYNLKSVLEEAGLYPIEGTANTMNYQYQSI